MDLAVGRFQKARDQPQRRGLAAAGWAEQADQLPMIDFQRDVIHYRKRTKSLGQTAQINGRQSPHSHSVRARISARLGIQYTNKNRLGKRVELEKRTTARLSVKGSHNISHCE